MVKYIISVIAAISVVGCASNETKVLRAQAMGANVELARAAAHQRSTLLIDAQIPVCSGVGECQIMTLKVANPAAADVKQIAMPNDEWAHVADGAVKTVGMIGGILAGGHVMTNLASEVGKVVGTTLAAQPDPTVVYQQPPVVVDPQQPVIVDPVIVPQPPYNDPIIVPAPETIIVDPVIVDGGPV